MSKPDRLPRSTGGPRVRVPICRFAATGSTKDYDYLEKFQERKRTAIPRKKAPETLPLPDFSLIENTYSSSESDGKDFAGTQSDGEAIKEMLKLVPYRPDRRRSCPRTISTLKARRPVSTS